MLSIQAHHPTSRILLVVAVAVALVTTAILAAPRASAQASATVTISGFAFNPATLTIEAGTTVTWVNDDAVPHTATENNGEFDTGQIDAGGSASVTFDTPGTYSYRCTIHPDMVGTIVVTEGDDGTDDGNGTDDGTDGGDDEGAPSLPDTGTGAPDNTSSAAMTASLLTLLAMLLAATGVALRRRSL